LDGESDVPNSALVLRFLIVRQDGLVGVDQIAKRRNAADNDAKNTREPSK